jgi:regulator of cell morphogenesis and NO signaling
MTVRSETTVRELALENPNATRVFEKLGIDYCCGGGMSLEEACNVARRPVNEVLAALAETAQQTTLMEPDWSSAPMAELIEHIVETHHRYTREEITRLQALLEKVCSVHGKNHPELRAIQATFRELSQELMMHMMKEEMVLFPYLVRMEVAVVQKEPVLSPPFGSVQNPVHMMMGEHDAAGEALRAMREASHGYAVPDDGCISYRTLFQAMQAFETDLHQHIHLENNVLFPRAVKMEESN